MREWERNYWFFKRSSFIIIEYPIPAPPMHSKLHPIITGYLFSEDINIFKKIHLTYYCARLNLVLDCLGIVITKGIFCNRDYAIKTAKNTAVCCIFEDSIPWSSELCLEYLLKISNLYIQSQIISNIFYEFHSFYSLLYTVFPHIRPAGIILIQGLQLRVLLERGY